MLLHNYYCYFLCIYFIILLNLKVHYVGISEIYWWDCRVQKGQTVATAMLIKWEYCKEVGGWLKTQETFTTGALVTQRGWGSLSGSSSSSSKKFNFHNLWVTLLNDEAGINSWKKQLKSWNMEIKGFCPTVVFFYFFFVTKTETKTELKPFWFFVD